MNIGMQIANTLRNGVIKTKISNFENRGQQGFVHPEDSLVKETLTNTLAILDEELKRADGLAAIIDYYCNNRYNWNTYKMSIHEKYKSIYELGYGNI